MPLPKNIEAFTKAQLVSLALEKYQADITGNKPAMLVKLQELAAAADAKVADAIAEVQEPDEVTIESADEEPNPVDEIIPPELTKIKAPPIELLSLDSSPERHPRGTTHLYNPANKMSHPASPALMERMDLIPITSEKHKQLMAHYGLDHGLHSTEAPKPR